MQNTHPTRRDWMSLGVLAAALAMIVLDGTIVGVALPSIIGDLDLGLAGAQWVNALYAVVFAALLLPVGQAGDRFGRRRFLVVGIIVFLLASALGGLSTHGTVLLLARALQGVGGAMVLPSTLATVNATFTGRSRAVAFGVWGAVMAGAAAIGPLLGGLLVTVASWHWVFWVNLPLGALILVGVFLVVDETRSERPLGADPLGAVLSSLGAGLLVFAIIEGGTLGWWRPLTDVVWGDFTWPSSRPISLVPVAAGLGLILTAVFIAWQLRRLNRSEGVILDLRLFRIENFSRGNIVALTVAAGEFSLVFILPLYLMGAAGLSVLQAGLVLAAMAGGAFLAGAGARHIAARFSPIVVVRIGLALEVVGVLACGLSARVSGPVWIIAATLAVYGVGLGLAAAQLTSTILADVPAEASGQGSATQSTLRQLGSGLGTAGAGAVLSLALPSALTARVDATEFRPLIDATLASAGTNLPGIRAMADAGRLGPDGQAVAQGFIDGFSVATAWVMLASAAALLVALVLTLRMSEPAEVSSGTGR